MIGDRSRGIEGLRYLAVCLLISASACSNSKSGTEPKQDAGAPQNTGGSTNATNTSSSTDTGLVSNVSCTNDSDCAPLEMVCDPYINHCVKCMSDKCKTSSTPLDSGASVTSGGNPCSSIPHFTGTQTLDGKGDDFCSIPPVTIDKASAGKVIETHSRPEEVVNARIAWSNEGLHAFFDVQDANVQVVTTADASQAINQAYQGDSIEVMLTSSNDVSGLTGTDANSLHVIVPASGPAISTKAANSNGATQGTATQLPASEYMQVSTSTGYSIELLLPWPGGTAPTPGSTIRFDMALNSADPNFGGVNDMRDGQLVYHVETVASSTCQGADIQPFCDDRTWCTSTLAP